MELTPVSVSQYLDQINEVLEAFTGIVVQGEITSLSNRGHIYFTVSDSDKKQKAVLNCALWKFKANSLPFDLVEGLEIQIIGKINVYKPNGRLTFVVDHVSPVGEGALQKAFEELKRRLKADGYFDPDKKQVLPLYPEKIGLLTSSAGEALRDFKKHLGEFGFELLQKDTRVEGLNAISSVVEGLEWFNKQSNPVEVIVLTRGGGSLESLQAFNSEEVAQAIFASKIPVLSAVGHERDVTIADFVADARASTPTDAGRVLSENWRLAEQKINQYQESFWQRVQRRLKVLEKDLDHELWRIKQSFSGILREYFEKLDDFLSSNQRILRRTINLWQERLISIEKLLKVSDPKLKLKQGYSLVRDEGGRLVKSVKSVSVGDNLNVQLADGKITSKVKSSTKY